MPDKREEEEIFLCQELATGKHIERILSVYVYHASYMFHSFSKLKEILKTVRPFISEHKYLMSQWSLGRVAFAAGAAADTPGRENTKPLQKPSET